MDYWPLALWESLEPNSEQTKLLATYSLVTLATVNASQVVTNMTEHTCMLMCNIFTKIDASLCC